MTEISGENLGAVKEFKVKDSSPQTPEIPWNQWLVELRDRFKYWTQKETTDPEQWPPKMPNLPEEHKRVGFEIPDEYEPDIVEANQRIRSIKGENTNGVFYRPGIGYGGALYQILEKIGTYSTMIVTDPAYKESEMVGWSEGILPIDYYLRTLRLIDSQGITVSLSDDYEKKGKVLDPQEYETAEIPAGGMATIDFKVNGVNLTLHLLAEDMTKFSPEKYDILGLGRPTPLDDKTQDPRHGEDFKIRAISRLAKNGIVDYSKGNFYFLPNALPPEVFGFKVVHSEDKRMIIQKVEDVGERLQAGFVVVDTIHEALGVLAGYVPGEKEWAGYYYKSVNKHMGGSKEIVLDDLVVAYRQRLNETADFIRTLPGEVQIKALKRLEFLFMNPIATAGKLDSEKVMKVHEIGSDPDDPSQNSFGPYFGRPGEIIADHNQGNIDIFEYYRKLISEFYSAFPYLKT